MLIDPELPKVSLNILRRGIVRGEIEKRARGDRKAKSYYGRIERIKPCHCHWLTFPWSRTAINPVTSHPCLVRACVRACFCVRGRGRYGGAFDCCGGGGKRVRGAWGVKACRISSRLDEAMKLSREAWICCVCCRARSWLSGGRRTRASPGLLG